MFSKYNFYVIVINDCYIILNCVPESIDIDNLKNQLIGCIPKVLKIHELHIWHISASTICVTAHIVFQSENVRNYTFFPI